MIFLLKFYKKHLILLKIVQILKNKKKKVLINNIDSIFLIKIAINKVLIHLILYNKLIIII